jgi:murein DD-endopeptidase MepM/ murein hydrolase activator NlpD
MRFHLSRLPFTSPRPCGPFISILFLVILLTGCVKPALNSRPWRLETSPTLSNSISVGIARTAEATSHPLLPATRQPSQPILSPTPDEPHALPTPRTDEDRYVVQRGDTLGTIAQRYGIEIEAIITANDIPNPDVVEVGTELIIPAPQGLPSGPDFKILPDSELVAGPASAFFDIDKFVNSTRGYLRVYWEDIDGVTLTGSEIIARISREYSVHPRLLLALLQYEAGWLTTGDPDNSSREYPLGYIHQAYKDLYRQLAWAANNLNRGYYLWRAGGITTWVLADGSLVRPAETINAGTAGVQYFFSLRYGREDWDRSVSAEGLFAIYNNLFDYPFDYAIEPLIPQDLSQPEMQLPFEPGAVWSFTGGPHGGWANGSGWAAIDFAPPGEALGCFSSDAWITAIASGRIVFSADGVVLQDMDEDGLWQTGWSILYMHVATDDRIPSGQIVAPGDRIGHPSCEGGISNGTHVHLARRYNGEWIPSDGVVPFNLEGWVSSGNGVEYDGWLTRGEQIVEAWDGRREENQIAR